MKFIAREKRAPYGIYDAAAALVLHFACVKKCLITTCYVTIINVNGCGLLGIEFFDFSLSTQYHFDTAWNRRIEYFGI